MKKLVNHFSAVFIFYMTLATHSVAATIDCEFFVSTVKVGETGRKESYVFACDSAYSCFSLGLIEHEATKLRYSSAVSALTTGNRLRLRFWGVATCEEAKSNMATPNSTWIIR